MAGGSAAPPILSLAHSPQSGSYTLTAAYQVVYTQSGTIPYLFAGAIINLTNMAAGDTVNLRVRKVVLQGGAWVIHDVVSFSDARPTNNQTILVEAIPDLYGIEIALQQVLGTFRAIPCEFFDARRLGL